MNNQKLIYTHTFKAKLSSCNKLYPTPEFYNKNKNLDYTTKLNSYTQYYLELDSNTKIEAYPTEKFTQWLKHNTLDPDVEYLFNGQFRTIREIAYPHEALVCNPLLGIKLDGDKSEQTSWQIPIRIFQVYKNVKDKYDNENFLLASCKDLNVNDKKSEFPIKLCFEKGVLENKYPDMQLVLKEGWATVERKGYNLFITDFDEMYESDISE